MRRYFTIILCILINGIGAQEIVSDVDMEREIAKTIRLMKIDVYKYAERVNIDCDRKWVDDHIKIAPEYTLVDDKLVITGKRRTLSIPSRSIYKGVPISTTYLHLDGDIIISLSTFYTKYSE